MNAPQIAEHPFVQGMKPEHVAALAEFAMQKRFAAGETIFREGDIANAFYLILSGRAELSSRKGGEALSQTIHAGDVLGWSWLVPPYRWHFDAHAIEATDAVFFYGTMLRAHCEEDHDLGYELMSRFAIVMMERLQKTREQLLQQQAALRATVLPDKSDGDTLGNRKNADSFRPDAEPAGDVSAMIAVSEAGDRG